MKDAIRQDIIEKRKILSPDEIKEKSLAIYERLSATDHFKNCDHLLIYADAKGEVRTEGIIIKALSMGKMVYLPRTGSNMSMDFYRIDSVDELECADFGIMSPPSDPHRLFKEKDISDRCLCIVPGVAFDRKCNRMGYGKGFYDRYLARVRIPHLIGLSYEFQIKDYIETGIYDIPMNMIITENNTYERSS